MSKAADGSRTEGVELSLEGILFGEEKIPEILEGGKWSLGLLFLF